MARKEIDILVEAARKGCAVVEKATGLLWTLADLLAARGRGAYSELSSLRPPDGRTEVSGPCPGICQVSGATSVDLSYRPVGQTDHFLIFAHPPVGVR